jgi:hypothetical protein
MPMELMRLASFRIFRSKARSVLTPHGTPILEERFEVTLTASKEKIEFTKDEVVLLVNKKSNPKLESIPEFQLYVGMTQYELVVTAMLMGDVDFEINKFSFASQRDNTTPSDLLASVNVLYVKLEGMKKTDGLHLAKFHADFDLDKETWNGLNLQEPKEGERNFRRNRLLILNALIAHFHAQFDPLLDHPVIKASLVFEHKRWPTKDKKAIETFGNDEIRRLADHFSCLRCMQDFDLPEALHQWEKLKREGPTMPFFKFTTFAQF